VKQSDRVLSDVDTSRLHTWFRSFFDQEPLYYTHAVLYFNSRQQTSSSARAGHWAVSRPRNPWMCTGTVHVDRMQEHAWPPGSCWLQPSNITCVSRSIDQLNLNGRASQLVRARACVGCGAGGLFCAGVRGRGRPLALVLPAERPAVRAIYQSTIAIGTLTHTIAKCDSVACALCRQLSHV
jgi:hypothetical protein